MSTQLNLEQKAVFTTVAPYPSAFIDEPDDETSGWDARPLFGDESPMPRAGHPEDLDQDDIPTVKMLLELPGDEPPPELMARAEPIVQSSATASAPSTDPDPDEQVTFTFVRDPIPAPDFKARLVEIHRRARFRITFRLPPIGPVSIGLILAMVVPPMQAQPQTNPPGFPTDACTFPDQPCFDGWETPVPLDAPDSRRNTMTEEQIPSSQYLQAWWIVEQRQILSGRV